MKIKLEDLRFMTSNFLATIKREDISTLDELIGKVNEKISVEGDERAHLSIESLNPIGGEPCIAFSYIVQDVYGIPIEFRLRGKNSPYSHVIIKCDSLIARYMPQGEDTFRNLIQNKILPYVGFTDVIRELELLRDL